MPAINSNGALRLSVSLSGRRSSQPELEPSQAPVWAPQAAPCRHPIVVPDAASRPRVVSFGDADTGPSLRAYRHLSPCRLCPGQGIDIPSNCSPRSHRSLAHIASPKTISGTRLTDRERSRPIRANRSIQTTSNYLSGYYSKNAHGALQAARERGRKGGRRPKQTQSALRNHSTQLNEGCAASEAARLFHRTTVERIGAEVK